MTRLNHRLIRLEQSPTNTGGRMTAQEIQVHADEYDRRFADYVPMLKEGSFAPAGGEAMRSAIASAPKWQQRTLANMHPSDFDL